jgi:hypothetical protein
VFRGYKGDTYLFYNKGYKGCKFAYCSAQPCCLLARCALRPVALALLQRLSLTAQPLGGVWRTGAPLSTAQVSGYARCLLSALSRVYSRCSFSHRTSSDLIYVHLNLIVPVLYFPHINLLKLFFISRNK